MVGFIDYVFELMKVSPDVGDRAAMISVMIGGFVAIVGLVLKFRKGSIDKAEVFSQIDERRLERMAEEANEKDADIKDLKRELALMKLERDHYYSRSRDLAFMLGQVDWTYKQIKVKEDCGGCNVVWPLTRDIDEIKVWAEESPVTTIDQDTPSKKTEK